MNATEYYQTYYQNILYEEGDLSVTYMQRKEESGNKSNNEYTKVNGTIDHHNFSDIVFNASLRWTAITSKRFSHNS